MRFPKLLPRPQFPRDGGDNGIFAGPARRGPAGVELFRRETLQNPRDVIPFPRRPQQVGLICSQTYSWKNVGRKSS